MLCGRPVIQLSASAIGRHALTGRLAQTYRYVYLYVCIYIYIYTYEYTYMCSCSYNGKNNVYETAEAKRQDRGLQATKQRADTSLW